MICIVATQDSKQILFLAINMPHLLRFAQTGINQHDTSQQSPLLLRYIYADCQTEWSVTHGHPGLQYFHVPLVNHINHYRRPLSLST